MRGWRRLLRNPFGKSSPRIPDLAPSPTLVLPPTNMVLLSESPDLPLRLMYMLNSRASVAEEVSVLAHFSPVLTPRQV